MQPALTKPTPPQKLGYGRVSLEGVDVLVGLGLTGRQARVYLATVKLGGGKAQKIMEMSAVGRQEIYPLINSLKEMGLVQKNLTKPTTYIATPITQVTNLLLQNKTNQLGHLTQQTQQLTKILEQNIPCMQTLLNPCFGTIFEADRGRRYIQAIEDAEGSIELVTSWVRFRQLSFSFETQLKAALKRDVALRFVAEKPPNHVLPRWINPRLPRYKFELKTTPNQPDAAITIFDGKQASIAFDKNVCLTQGIDLWTTHSALVAVCQAYFYRVWGSIRE
jgi:Predicted transcriptional regulators